VPGAGGLCAAGRLGAEPGMKFAGGALKGYGQAG